MDTLNPETVLFLLGVSSVISLLILYIIIGSATYSTQRRNMAESQLKLLVSIARKLGVDEEQIHEDIGLHKK